MSLATDYGKGQNILELSGEADKDLSDYQWCLVSWAANSSGRVEVTSPSGQGVICAGILQNDDADADGEMCSIRVLGTTKAKTSETFNTGVELTASGTAGTVEEAASGDYVQAIALQASTEAGELVWVQVISPYQKN